MQLLDSRYGMPLLSYDVNRFSRFHLPECSQFCPLFQVPQSIAIYYCIDVQQPEIVYGITELLIRYSLKSNYQTAHCRHDRE